MPNWTFVQCTRRSRRGRIVLTRARRTAQQRLRRPSLPLSDGRRAGRRGGGGRGSHYPPPQPPVIRRRHLGWRRARVAGGRSLGARARRRRRGGADRAGRAGHVATLKTIDPPLRALEGRRFAGARAPGQAPALPDRRRRARAARPPDERGPPPLARAGAKGPKTPAFRLDFEGGGAARPHRGGLEEARGRLAADARSARRRSSRTSGPDALELDAERAGGDPAQRDSRRLHPLLRDQRAIAGIGRAQANEILLRAKLSPFALSTELADEEIERLAAAIDDRARPRRSSCASAARTTRHVYRVHNRLGEPCHACGTPIARVDFEEHTIYYCPHVPDRRARAQGPPAVAAAPLAELASLRGMRDVERARR